MGIGGQGNLKGFLQFLKVHCSGLGIDSHTSREGSAYPGKRSALRGAV